MSHQTKSDRNSARTQRRIALALTALFSPALLTAPASAEPQPWHNPEYVAESSLSSRCGQLPDGRTEPTSWASRSRCPVRTTATPPQPNKAQIEHDE
ncbi:MAG TPA: hypothetical protein PLT68_09025, partial [Actinomycetota bacterium]|nr:hypothetical protein [Actinomycetota bacterium]